MLKPAFLAPPSSRHHFITISLKRYTRPGRLVHVQQIVDTHEDALAFLEIHGGPGRAAVVRQLDVHGAELAGIELAAAYVHDETHAAVLGHHEGNKQRLRRAAAVQLRVALKALAAALQRLRDRLRLRVGLVRATRMRLLLCSGLRGKTVTKLASMSVTEHFWPQRSHLAGSLLSTSARLSVIFRYC